MKDFFREIGITAARGKNNFTMDRGSFSYDQDISAEKKLTFIGTDSSDNGYDHLFELEGERFVFSVRGHHIHPGGTRILDWKRGDL